MLKRLFLAAAIALLPLAAFAQVQQSGTVTPTHPTMWTTNGVIQDAGTSANGKLSTLGITANGGTPFCINSGPITGPYEQFCLGMSSGGDGTISLQSIGGATTPTFNVKINGTSIPQLGAIPNGTLLSNISGSSANASANGLSAIIDSILGSTEGNVLYRSSTGWTTLPPGSNGNCLTYTSGGTPVAWGSCAGTGGTGTVTSVTAGTGLSSSPSPIVASGTVSLSVPVTAADGGSGLVSPSANAVLLGNGASAFQTVDPSTSGNVLTSNGSTWVSSPGPGGLVLLQTKSASGVATVDFTTSIDATYDEYLFVLSGILPATDAQLLDLQISTDGGATWKAGGTDYRRVFNVLSSAGTNTVSGTSGESRLVIANNLSNNTGRPLGGEVRLFEPSSAMIVKPFTWQLGAFDGSNVNLYTGTGTYVVGTAITGVRFLMGSGNIASGTFSMYGISK